MFVDKDQQYEFQLQLDATADPQLTSRTLDSTQHMGVWCGAERGGGRKGDFNKQDVDGRMERMLELVEGCYGEENPQGLSG